jgi:hypothetical protein
MGLGAALIFPATLSLLTNVFTERRERARAIGLWGSGRGAARKRIRGVLPRLRGRLLGRGGRGDRRLRRGPGPDPGATATGEHREATPALAELGGAGD